MSNTLTESLRAACPQKKRRPRTTWAHKNPDIVRAILAMLEDNIRSPQIAAALNARGIPAPYGGRWTGPAVRRAVESVR